jgi:hypothetical protein
MRIHFKNAKTQKEIFGAVVVDLVEYVGFFEKESETQLMFLTKNHGVVYANFEMLDRVKERYVANGIDTQIIDKAFESYEGALCQI